MRDSEPRRRVKSWTGEDHLFFHNQDKEEKEGYRCEYTAHWRDGGGSVNHKSDDSFFLIKGEGESSPQIEG